LWVRIVVGNENDAVIRAALIAAARTQMGRDDASLFNIKGLCAEASVSDADFRRCFAGREALIAAVLEQETVLPAEPRRASAVENGTRAVAPPAPDAWLERRLRVFERALAALEARQEKSEQLLNRSVALLEEKITRPAEKHDPPGPMSVVEAEKPRETPALKPETVAAVIRMAPLPVLEPDPQPTITPQEMEDLLANARRVAREATVVVPPSKPRRVPPWIAWAVAGCVIMIVVTALALSNVLGASALADGVRHRQIQPHSLERVTALADSGDARSQTVLALAYLDGKAVSSDRRAALRWGLAAAKQGDPMAQYLLGTFYQDGDGVHADLRQAFNWFEAAALRGNIKAMHDLAIAYAEGQGTPRDASRAAAWFNRAAGQGYLDSQFDLAVLFERGEGVRQNPVTALKWYLIAAKSGDKQARDRADQLAREMPGDDVARAQSLAARFAPANRDSAANHL
jgi:AcrR family transcriptional regulator